MEFDYNSIPKNVKSVKVLNYKKIACTSKPVNLESPTLREDMEKLGWKMVKSCVENNGVGLAAPQIGILKKVFITIGLEKPDVWKFDGKFHMYINPTIKPIRKAERVAMPEGCLSVPGKMLNIYRPREIEVSYWYFDNKGKLKQSTGEILNCYPARMFLHENDHLEGMDIVKLHERQNSSKPRRGRPPGSKNKSTSSSAKNDKKPKRKTQRKARKKRRGNAVLTEHKLK